MPVYLDTRGKTRLAIGICARCKFKYALDDLSPDPNIPGLLVCNNGCKDNYDPWRLPGRPSERIGLDNPRPDEPLAETPAGVATEGNEDEFIETDGDGDWWVT